MSVDIRCRLYLGVVGDKEIAVRIRSNSHYRISFLSQVGMLIAL